MHHWWVCKMVHHFGKILMLDKHLPMTQHFYSRLYPRQKQKDLYKKVLFGGHSLWFPFFACLVSRSTICLCSKLTVYIENTLRRTR